MQFAFAATFKLAISLQDANKIAAEIKSEYKFLLPKSINFSEKYKALYEAKTNGRNQVKTA